AILRVAAFLDSAVAHERGEALVLLHLTGGMRVEQPHLCDGGCAYEISVLIELRADFHAAAAGDAARERVRSLLLLLRHARAGAEIVGAINRDPGFDAL